MYIPVWIYMLFLLWRTSPKHCLYPWNHLHHAKWFYQIIISTGIKALNFVKFHALCSRHYDWNILCLWHFSHLFKKCDPIFTRKHYIHKYKFRKRVRTYKLFPKWITVLKPSRIKTGTFKRIYLNIAYAVIIFNAPNHYNPLSFSKNLSPHPLLTAVCNGTGGLPW